VPHPPMAKERKHRILERLNAAEAFEKFLATKYVGTKRFGIEGAESAIPILDEILSSAADEGLRAACSAWPIAAASTCCPTSWARATRRSSRSSRAMSIPSTVQGSGDVKYHLGATGKYVSPRAADIPVELAANPSHLETVNPIVMGMVRAEQDQIDPPGIVPGAPGADPRRRRVRRPGCGGRDARDERHRRLPRGRHIHLIINNQIGFTTAPQYARSSIYCSDVAKTIQAPIFHVNGDDPEACVRVAKLAWEYRQTFHKDVVIDMVCYRRHGHNEGDDPSYTQPLMYKAIAERRSVRKLFVESLVKRGDITVEEAEQALGDFQNKLQVALDETRSRRSPPTKAPAAEAARRAAAHSDRCRAPTLDRVFDQLTDYPDGFTIHPKLGRQFEARSKLLLRRRRRRLGHRRGVGDRLAGPRGTPGASGRAGLASRHVQPASRGADRLRDREPWIPLNELGAAARFWVYDSLLSEYAALGYEYGYAHANPEALVMWEAQFGDFINGAQIVIDQYLVAAEDKWGQQNGLVLLLPHGYEGQGPEHSSARIERFLILAAEDNIQLVNATTAAQYFHLLRRQIHSERRTPLVVFTPKQGLRMKQTRSKIDELTTGSFQEVIDDPLRDRSRVDPPGRVLQRQGRLGRDVRARRPQGPGGRRASRAALPAADRADAGPPRQVSQRQGAALAPGGAREHGPWNFVEHRTWRVKERGYDLATRRARRVGQPGHRLQDRPRPGARRAHGADRGPQHPAPGARVPRTRRRTARRTPRGTRRCAPAGPTRSRPDWWR
jgi:multifunctional 2-oxoglutarate metabolism enzyme